MNRMDADIAVKLTTLPQRIENCERCPELREYCREVGEKKRKAYESWTYWAKPVPAFGDLKARIVIVGLAPGAHGANRTGRMFTGDRSGDFLYAGLYRAGLANQPQSISRDDGLELQDVYITAAVRCAPPGNKPTKHQKENCLPYMCEELAAIQPRVLLCLGQIGWEAAIRSLRRLNLKIPSPKPRFAHAGMYRIDDGPTLLGCYHVSQQNTFTGRLTEFMLDSVLAQARRLASGSRSASP